MRRSLTYDQWRLRVNVVVLRIIRLELKDTEPYWDARAAYDSGMDIYAAGEAAVAALMAWVMEPLPEPASPPPETAAASSEEG